MVCLNTSVTRHTSVVLRQIYVTSTVTGFQEVSQHKNFQKLFPAQLNTRFRPQRCNFSKEHFSAAHVYETENSHLDAMNMNCC